ncbi:MAG TPA: adenosylmethionine--8-amino-7-oxononanoate transaminase [Polyangiaceae bacterium]|nr:adenosylmethionine--8-amino-7-oxononanoate transaminase [Polyangiaceae bacterium]
MAVPREAIIARDKRHVWHPYTAMGPYLAHTEPLVIESARGARLFDRDGRSYLDGNSSWWTCVLGHGHPRIVAALHEQAERLCHTSLAGVTHEHAALLAEEIVQTAPAGLSRVFFSDDGSTAVEVALKLALQYWQQNGRAKRTRFLALDGAFHGETLGATALGGVEVFRRPFASVVLDCIHVPPAHDGHERAFAALEQSVRDHADSLAAVVLEPMIQGAAGMRTYDAEYLRRARELTERHDVFLVLDEVFSGYGRTGPMWASEHAGVAPDLMCTAKGFTAGTLPMAATLATQRIFEGFLGDASRAFYYGHTFCGNPLGARVAREVLAVYRDERILDQVRVKGARIARAFAELAGLPGVSAVRGIGMVGALDLGREGYLERAGWQVFEEGLKRGAYLRPLGNTVYVAPPLNIADDELELLLGIFADSVRAALAQS